MFLISVNIENVFDSVGHGFTKNNRMKLITKVVVVTDYPLLSKKKLTKDATDEGLYLLSETVNRILSEQVIGVPLY